MPKATRQSPNGPPAPPTAPPSEAVTAAVKLVVYGETKTGKTRLAATFPKPMLLIGAEDGTRSVCDGRRRVDGPGDAELYALTLRGRELGIDFCRLARTDQLEALADLAAAGRGGVPYRSVGLDTAGKLQELHVREFLGLTGPVVQLNWGMTDQRGWGAIGERTKRSLRALLDLHERHGLHVVIVAHERTFGGDNEAAADVIQPKVGCALMPSVAGWLHTEADYLCQTFKRERVEYTPLLLNGQPVLGPDNQPQRTERRTGKAEYCLRIGEHTVYMTGFRLPPSGPPLPDALVDPSYEAITRVIRGEYGTAAAAR